MSKTRLEQSNEVYLGQNSHELVIWDQTVTDTKMFRKEFVQFMNGNVGGRGRDWSMEKPRQNRGVIVCRIKDKEKAALVKLKYAEVLATKAQYDMLRRR